MSFGKLAVKVKTYFIPLHDAGQVHDLAGECAGRGVHVVKSLIRSEDAKLEMRWAVDCSPDESNRTIAHQIDHLGLCRFEVQFNGQDLLVSKFHEREQDVIRLAVKSQGVRAG